MKVFIYVRVSTAGQLDGSGLDRQEETCREFAARKGWQVARVFKEQQSGSDSYSDRKQLSEALTLASGPDNALGIDTIIIEHSDRLARDLIVAELFLQKCKELGVKVYTAASGEELVNSEGNPTRTLIRQVLGAVAQFDKSSIVRKMQAGRKAKADRTGSPCGGPTPSPYGDRGGIAQRNLERDVVRYIFDLRAQGQSYNHIAKRLYNARVKNPNGGAGGVNPAFSWSGKTVYRIVKYWEDREL